MQSGFKFISFRSEFDKDSNGFNAKRLRLVLSIHGFGLELESLLANPEHGIAERLPQGIWTLLLILGAPHPCPGTY